ncbi:MAG: hypothetical protein AAF197_06240 [Pseudomonadota bacterium]
MLLRRVTQHLKAQNWFAVFLDFLIVVVGVFIGIQVANWNDSRAARAMTDRTLELLIPLIERLEKDADGIKDYYATTKAYGKVAFKAWANDGTVSDSDFIIAAYQASQIVVGTYDAEIVAEMIGAENIRNIVDSDLQRRLQLYITNPSNVSRIGDLDTPYRQNVRRAIPFAIQERIRSECGDQRPDIMSTPTLPTACKINFSAELVRPAADQLRQRKDLRDDLQWHIASTESVLFDFENELARNNELIAAIKAYLK